MTIAYRNVPNDMRFTKRCNIDIQDKYPIDTNHRTFLGMTYEIKKPKYLVGYIYLVVTIVVGYIGHMLLPENFNDKVYKFNLYYTHN